MKFYLIQILFVALNLIESRYDYYTIKIQNTNLPDFVQLRFLWKRWNTLYYVVVIGIVSVIGWLMYPTVWARVAVIAALICNRAIFFELPINVWLYGWGKIFYVDQSSKTNIELQKLFGNVKNLGVYRAVIAALVIVLVNIFV